MRFMKAIDEILKRRLGHESGFAVPTVLFVVLAAFAVVSVGSLTTIRAQSGVVRDQDTKSAFAASDAGANQALLHYNRIATTPDASCLVPGAGGVLVAQQPAGWVAGTSWCPAVSGSVADGTFAYGSFTYQARPGTTGGLEIVSTGDADGVSRRIELTAKPGGDHPFSSFGVMAQDGIDLDSNAQIYGNVGTNGSITTSGTPNSYVDCSSAQVGINGTADDGVLCPSTQGTLTLPPVLQGDAATNNDNARITSGADVVSRHKQACWDGSEGRGPGMWDGPSCVGDGGGPRRLIFKNATITLGGSKYSFCKLVLDGNSELLVANGATVQIFFDSPEACGLSSGEAQLELRSNSRITSTSGQPVNLQLLFVGSTSTPPLQSTILLNSNTQVSNTNCEQNFVLYAPLHDIDLDSNSGYCGAIAGKSLHLDSNAAIQSDPNAGNFVLPGGVPYVADRYVECGAYASGDPDAGC